MSFLGSFFGRLNSSVSPTKNSPPPSSPKFSQNVEEGLDMALDFLSSVNEITTEVSSAKPTCTLTSSTTAIECITNASPVTHHPPQNRKVSFESVKENDYYLSSSPSRVLSPLRPIPSLKQRPTSSILKPYQPSLVNSNAHREFASFQQMMENLLRQLAAGNDQSRIDAYQSFLSAVQAKISVPEQDILLDAAASLLEFTIRDIVQSNSSSQEPSSHQIVTWALKFLTNLTRMIPVSKQHEFQSLATLVDVSTSVLEKSQAPRAILHHHMVYLCQRFSPKIMTSERTLRIMNCLARIHERVQGSNVKVYRLIIYQQCLEIAPQVMTSKASDWLRNMLSSLVSNKLDIRQNAILLGDTAALRHPKQLQKSIEDIFSSKSGNVTFMNLFVKQLDALLDQEDRSMACAAPKIFIIVALFLRHRFQASDFWRWFKPWLTLCSKALNSTDRQVKLEAYSAWKRLIFAVMPDKCTILQVRHMLKSPFADPLLKQRELQQGPGRAIMSGYLCLIYYALRPTASFEDIDLYWDEYVVSILTNLASPKRQTQQLYCAASILQALLSSLEKWNESRANSTQPFEFDELARLDPVWIRSRLTKVLPLIEAVLTHAASWVSEGSSANVPDDEDTSFASCLALSTWSSVIDCIKEAGAKEVTASAALKSSIAAIMGTLHKVAKWFELQQLTPSFTLDASKAFQALVERAISQLGTCNFTDRMLVWNPDSHIFDVAPTPSHHQPLITSQRSPITHIFDLHIQIGLNLNASKPSEALNPSFHTASSLTMLHQIWKSLSLKSSKISMIADLFELLGAKFAKTDAPIFVRELAGQVMSLVEEEITRPNITGFLTEKDFEAILAICKHALLVTRQVPQGLFAHAVDAAKQAAGVGGLLLAVTEPHAMMVHQLMTHDDGLKYEPLLTYTKMIIDCDIRPRNWAAIERGRKALSNATLAPTNRSRSIEVEFRNLPSLINYSLKYGYTQLRPSGDAQTYASLIGSLFQYFNRAPGVSHAVLLRQVQDGISTVLKDGDFYIRDYPVESGKQTLISAVPTLWRSITQFLKGQNTSCLNCLESIILSGLTSPRRSIVNATIAFWNDLMQDNDTPIECPDSILTVVKALSLQADVRLPCDVTVEDDLISNDDEIVSFPYSQHSPTEKPKFKPASVLRKLQTPQKLLRNRQQQTTKEPEQKKQTPRRKLRHDDSQIIFEIIESSPVPDNESQNLTGRQKEVAARQHSDVAMFSDINLPAARRSDFESLQAATDSDPGSQSDVLVCSSDAEDLQSSPPTSPMRASDNQQSDDIDAPSSPVTALLKRKHERMSRVNCQNSQIGNKIELHPAPIATVEIRSSPPPSEDEETPRAALNASNRLSHHSMNLENESKEGQVLPRIEGESLIPNSFDEELPCTSTILHNDASELELQNELSSPQSSSSAVMLVDCSFNSEFSFSQSNNKSQKRQCVDDVQDETVLPEIKKRKTVILPDYNIRTRSGQRQTRIERNEIMINSVELGSSLSSALTSSQQIFASACEVAVDKSQVEQYEPAASLQYNIISQLEQLVTKAKGVEFQWTANEQRRIADLSFEIQALSRGR